MLPFVPPAQCFLPTDVLGAAWRSCDCRYVNSFYKTGQREEPSCLKEAILFLKPLTDINNTFWECRGT